MPDDRSIVTHGNKEQFVNQPPPTDGSGLAFNDGGTSQADQSRERLGTHAE